MVPDLSFGVPDFVAVEISGDDYRLPIEPFGMSHQCLIDLPNVAAFSTRPDCAGPDRDQDERRRRIDLNGHYPLLLRLGECSNRPFLPTNDAYPLMWITAEPESAQAALPERDD